MSRLALRLTALGAGALGALFAGQRFLHSAQSAPAPLRLASVQVLSDRLQPVTGATVRLTSSTGENVVVSDAQGQTPWVNAGAAGALTLTLAETTQAQGVLIGMIETLTPPAEPSAEDAALNEISRTQPLATPIVVQGAANTSTTIDAQDGSFQHWCVLVPAGSTLRFRAHAASLLDGEAIEQYLRYRGDSIHQSVQYTRGVALVVPDVRIGSGGFIVGLDLLGDLTSGVTIDAFNYTKTSTPTSFSIESLGVIGPKVFVKVTGELRQGHLALLARPQSDASPAQTLAIQDAPPQITVPEGGGAGIDSVMRDDCIGCGESLARAGANGAGGAGSSTGLFTSTSALVTDCEPVVPNMPPGWECDCSVADPSGCGVTPGAKECHIVRMRSPRFCRPAGASIGVRRGETSKWKVTFEFKAGTGTPITSGGGFEYGEGSETVVTDGWTAQPGANNLGQCTRYFNFRLACGQWFTTYVAALQVNEYGYVQRIPCAAPMSKQGVCVDKADSQSTCDRTP